MIQKMPLLALTFLSLGLIAAILPAQAGQPSAIDDNYSPTETINGSILALAATPGGGAYIGGNFLDISGSSTHRFLAKINDDGSCDSTFAPAIDGPVAEILLQKDGKIVVGGDFENASGWLSRDLARFHPDGTPDAVFNSNIGEGSNGSVKGLDLLPDGRILVAGIFSSWAGVSLNPNRDLIILNSDGTLQGAFEKGIFSDTLTDVVLLPDGKILASHNSDNGGAIKVTRFKNDFRQDSGFSYGSGRQRVRRLGFTADGNYLFAGTETLMARPNASVEIISDRFSNDLFEQSNGRIVAAGSEIARFLPDGTDDPDFLVKSFNPGGVAHRLAIRDDGKIWIAGSFTSYGDNSASKIVLINGDATPLAIISQPETVILDPDQIARFAISAVGASTLSYQWKKNGIALNNTVRITGADSASLVIADLNFNDQGNYTCTVTNEAGTRISESASLFVRGIPQFIEQPTGGNFPAGSVVTISGEVIGLGSVTYQWKKNGITLTDGGSISGATTNVLILSRSKISDSGNYTLETRNILGSAVSNTANIIVEFNPAAVADDYLPPSLNGSVLAIQNLDGGAVLVGGLFTTISNGGFSGGRYLSVVERNGSIRDLPGLTANGAVRAINRDSAGNFLLAGDFTAINGVLRSRAARLLPDLSVDPAFNPGTGPNFNLFNIREASDGKIHVAGKHTAWNGDDLLGYHVRLNADGTVDSTFMSLANNWIHDAIPLSDGKILLGGSSFNPDGDTTTNQDNYFFRINNDGTFDPHFEGDVELKSPTKLLIDGRDRIYTNSPFGNILNRFLNDGSLDVTFPAGRPDGTVTSMFLDSENRLLVGGTFNRFDDEKHILLVRLRADDTIDEKFEVGSGPDQQIDAIAESADGSIWIGGAFSNYNGVFATNLIRLVGNVEAPVDPLTEFLVAAGVPEDRQGPNDDPDGDGLPNVIEFIYNSNPVKPESILDGTTTNLVKGGQIPGAGLDPAKQYYLLNLKTPKDTMGYTLVPEGSSDLIKFDEVQLIPYGEPVKDEGFVSQRYYFLPDRGSSPKMFWRLKAVSQVGP